MAFIPWKNKRGGHGGDANPLVELRGEMDRLFDTFIRDPWGSLSEGLGGQRQWQPAVDVAETDQEVTIRAEIPGVDPKELEISVSGNRLTIAGEKKNHTEKQGKDYYHTETRYGAFRRSIELPGGVDPEQVSAEHANGVVTIRLKKQTAASRKIEVKTV
jgi:HSP20 family protein